MGFRTIFFLHYLPSMVHIHTCTHAYMHTHTHAPSPAHSDFERIPVRHANTGRDPHCKPRGSRSCLLPCTDGRSPRASPAMDAKGTFAARAARSLTNSGIQDHMSGTDYPLSVLAAQHCSGWNAHQLPHFRRCQLCIFAFQTSHLRIFGVTSRQYCLSP